MLFNPHKVLKIHKLLKHVPLNGLLDRPYQRALKKAVNLADLRRIAQRRAHKMIFDYLDGGSDDEITLRRNKDAFLHYEMHYHVLAGIQPPLDLSTTLFGHKLQIPFFGCPTAGNKMFHSSGEEAAAQAATQNGTLYAMSSLSTTSFSRIAEIAPTTPKLFQLYVWRDKQLVRDILHQAKETGFDALALTVDVPWMGNRERDLRNQFSVPPNYSLPQTIAALQSPAWTYDFLSHEPYQYACINRELPAETLVHFINSQLTPDFHWNDAEWLLGEWHTSHTALKGVIRPDDALRAQQTGFSTLWISNHGGRQMDTAPATIDVLPDIRAAVGPHLQIILDGGIQRGTDIAKALALGANGVGIGKPYLWGLAAGGTQGVLKAYEILKIEFNWIVPWACWVWQR
jgi:L-lactate dehydrogenase (cytochrome)